MKNLEQLLSTYKEIKAIPSFEEEQALLYEYVYLTNKLEGNKLSLIQTNELFKSDTISGKSIKNSDILEQKGMYKALKRMLQAVREKETLSIKLMLNLNWLVIGNLWNDDYYSAAKDSGQEINRFKKSQNVISIKNNNVEIEKIIPESNPENVEQNMIELLKKIENSEANIVEKAAFLAQEIWIHQPFVDGNKRTGRLLVNFLLMKNGFPLFVYDEKTKNYNSLLVEQYLENKNNLIIDYISNALSEKLTSEIEKSKNVTKKFGGFRMMI